MFDERLKLERVPDFCRKCTRYWSVDDMNILTPKGCNNGGGNHGDHTKSHGSAGCRGAANGGEAICRLTGHCVFMTFWKQNCEIASAFAIAIVKLLKLFKETVGFCINAVATIITGMVDAGFCKWCAAMIGCCAAGAWRYIFFLIDGE